MRNWNNHLVGVLLSSATFWLCGCQGELAVVENLDDGSDNLAQAGGGGAPSFSPDGGFAGDCSCASSPGLQALGCELGHAPPWGNDVVHTTVDGSVVAFNVCKQDGGFCDMVRWTQAGELDELGPGYVTGLSAAGDRVLVGGLSGPYGQALTLIDANGDKIDTGLSGFDGRGALSASGEIVVGNAEIDGVVYLARWTESGVEPIHEFEFGAMMIANSDATAIVGLGLSDSGSFEPMPSFHWTASAGFGFGLPGIAGVVDLASPESLSSDGSVIAGGTRERQSFFRWTAADGFREIASSTRRSQALLSLDGSVLAGNLGGDNEATSRVFRWTEATGAQQIAPGVAAFPMFMSDDGGVIVARTPNLDEPWVTYVWDEANGARKLEDLLTDRGVDRSGWTFGNPRKLSSDGKVLLGIGTCGGRPTTYRVEL
jgi:hypothetical protein